jgi:MFS family permease
MGLLTLGFIPLLFGMPFQTLLPLFAERVHGVGALGLGIMTAAVGAGALVGSVAVAILARGNRLGVLQAILGVGFGGGLVGFALAPSFWVAIVALVVAGVSYAGYLAVNETLIMAHTDREFYGRVMSVYLLSFGLMPVASFPEAFVADHIGGPLTIAAAGAIVAASVLLAQLVPSYRRLG